MWGGANDVFFQSGQILAGAETLDQANARLTAAAHLEGGLIDRLQAAGVRHLIVFSLPDIGLTPGGEPHDTGMAQTFNAVLNGELAGRHGVVAVNTFALLREVAANPAAFGFSDATTPACTVSPALICTPATLVQPDAASTHVFADGIHPTSTAHAVLAEVVASELNAPGQMSLLAEAPLAMLREHRAAVHDQLDAAAASPRGLTLFAAGRAGRRALDGDQAAPAGASDDDSLTVGGVWRSDGGLALGAAFTAGRSRFSLQGGLGGFDARQTAVSAFGQHRWTHGGWASLQAGFGGVDYRDISRSFVLGPAMRTERAASVGHDDSVEIAGGRNVTLGRIRTGPFAAVSYDRVRVGDVAEASGDSTAMWFAAQTREAVVARIGWSLKGDARLAGIEVKPVAAVVYGHDFRADRTSVAAGLTTFNGDFSAPGYQPSRNWGEATLGLGCALSRRLNAQISYQGLYGDRGHENMGVAGLSLSF
jgi:outer membrane lipase/esterase